MFYFCFDLDFVMIFNSSQGVLIPWAYISLRKNHTMFIVGCINHILDFFFEDILGVLFHVH